MSRTTAICCGIFLTLLCLLSVTVNIWKLTELLGGAGNNSDWCMDARDQTAAYRALDWL